MRIFPTFIWIVNCLSGGIVLMANNDTNPPTIESPAIDISIDCADFHQDSLASWYDTFAGLEATDEEGEVVLQSTLTFEIVQATFESSIEEGCLNQAQVNVGFFALDNCGNSSVDTSYATFTVVDNTRPEISIEATDISIVCDESLPSILNEWIINHGGAEALDDCSNVSWNEYLWTDNQGNSGFGIVGEDLGILIERESCNWFANVSFFASDTCGNRTTTISRVSVIDTEAPYFLTFPEDITVSCDKIPDLDDYQVLDYCESNLTYLPEEFTTQLDDPTSCDYFNYLIERVYNVSDACGNNLSHTQLISVVDTLGPEVSFDPVFDASCTTNLDEITDFISYSDPCGGDLIVEYMDTDVSQGNCMSQIDRSYLITDVCGNDTTFTQRINLIDNLPPTIQTFATDLIIPCDTILSFDQILTDWIEDLGGSIATDACSQISSFVAESGSFDLVDSSTYPGILPNVPREYCQVSEDGIVFTEQYSIVYFDACGNSSQTVASIIILDEESPLIHNCAEVIKVPLSGTDCAASASIPIPDVEDNCQSIDGIFVSQKSSTISSDNNGSQTTLVNPIHFVIDDLNVNQIVKNDAEITIEFLEFDGDGFQEYFNILIEGTNYGRSPRLIEECQDTMFVISEIPADTIRHWLSDGKIEVTLEPNVPPGNGSLGVNDICNNSLAIVTLSTQVDNVNLIEVMYSLDGSEPIFSNERDTLVLELEEGSHSVDFIFKDCGGNINTCTSIVDVEDNQPPDLTCPSDTILTTEVSSCCVSYQLSTDFMYLDNCIASGRISETLPEGSGELSFNFNSISQSFVAINRQFAFTIPNASQKILENPQLRIDVTANTEENPVILLDDRGQIFVELDSTNIESCSNQSSQLLDIDIDRFDTWIQDDTIRFTFVGAGLPPCDVVENGKDGVSNLKLTLLYSDIQPNYAIEGDTLITGTITDLQDSPIHELCVGDYVITYSVQDATGNIGDCTYSVSVSDMIPPEVICLDTAIVLPLDGLLPVDIRASDIVQLTSDNCSDVSIELDINQVDCNDVNSTIEVTVTATDESGNEAICMSNVQVIQQQVTPTFSIGICQDEDLQLFANIPITNSFEALQVLWSGPNNYISNQVNPIIAQPELADAGIYNLTVTGLNGCMVTSSVDVQIDQFMDPNINVPSNNICVGDDLVLTADSYSGVVVYSWYEGAFPNGILVGETDEPSLDLIAIEGLHFYYVIVDNSVCTSNPSTNAVVEVSAVPVAQISNPFLTVCEGDPIQLRALESPITGVEYIWSGPNGYQGDGFSPVSIPNATFQNEGTYIVTVENNGCISASASVQVVLFDRPDKPIISGDNIVCENTLITLSVSNITNADVYNWYKDGLLFSNTASNTLSINNSTADLEGQWTVSAEIDLCTSEFSDPFILNVESSLQIGVGNTSPVCVGDSVILISTLISQATYTWQSPSGTLINGQSPIIIAEAGEYTLTVTNSGGCEASESTTVITNSPPIVTALSNSAPLCESTDVTIEFSPTIFPAGDYEYAWSGPNDFSSTLLNPQINGATSADNGIYSLTVIDGDCTSVPVSTTVSIGETASQPEIINVNNTCQGEILQLIATPVNDPSVEYVWITPVGTKMTTTNVLLLANIGTENSGSYRVSIQSEGCDSDESTEILVEVSPQPESPEMLVPNLVCSGDEVILSVVNPNSNYTYLWTGPSGTSNQGVTWVLTDVEFTDVGTYTVEAQQARCVSENQATGTFFVRSRPQVPQTTFLDTLVCLGDLSNFEYCFDQDNVFSFDSVQLVDLTNDSIILNSTTPCSMLDLSYLEKEEGFFAIQSYRQGCVSERSQTINITVQDDSEVGAKFFMDSLTICDNSFAGIFIDDVDVLDSIIVSSSTSTIQFEVIDNAVINILNVESDAFQLYVSTIVEECGEVSRDTLHIERQEEFNISDQILQLPSVGITSIDLLHDAPIDYTYDLTILDEPDNLSFSLQGATSDIVSTLAFVGNDNITYMICNEMCPMLCDTVNILLQVGNPTDCIVSNVVTPNNDGFNDAFRVPCLADSRFDSNRLRIFNRWGDEVFTASPYLNDWDANYQGSELPSGTYFYILTLNADREPMQGFIVVER